ncbi:hypothetical protein CTAYLR_000871 [Chrysophaeum taylorii]|uniref:Chloride channel protein n=1 Tax=Chrysophaeum taylorii TaxID=2483200 RepID=A0AAD7UQV7_9STRA|nr:hypothetical protein CTAYLR_000871 [Chrysophaeum taylorii]
MGEASSPCGTPPLEYQTLILESTTPLQTTVKRPVAVRPPEEASDGLRESSSPARPSHNFANRQDRESERALEEIETSLNQTQLPRDDYRRGDEVGGATTWSSLNYEEFINDASIAASRRWTPKRRRVCFGYSGRTLARWVVTCAIGVTMGGVAIGLSRASDALLSCRNGLVSLDGSATSFAVFVAWGGAIGAASSGLVAFVAPGASGSGIPQVKAYLNGVRLEGCLSVRVFCVKLLGTVLSVGSGASLGPEGPLVHLGAISGSFVTGGLDPTRFCVALRRLMPRAASRNVLGLFPSAAGVGRDEDDERRGTPPPFFRSDLDRRDFLSIGAACGFSAAFGAPIGGVLFSLEEASSFWSNELLWRSLVGAVLSTFTALALEHNIVGLSEVSRYGLISLRGKADNQEVSLALLPLAAIFGVFGGVLGAGFNASFYRIMRCRQRLAKAVERAWEDKEDEDPRDPILRARSAKAVARLVDATLGVCLTSFAFYAVARASRSWACVDRDEDDDGWLRDDIFTIRFNCAEGKVHELASLWFGSRERAIKKILEASAGEFNGAGLALSGVLTFCTLALSFGSSLPGGLFLPLIFCGASLGGAVARLDFVETSHLSITRRHMSLLGAVALLAGVQRSTVSLCVIMLEGTGNTALLIPIIVVVCVARFVGNSLGDGLYELSLELQSVPFLERHVHAGLEGITVKSFCRNKPPPVSFPLRPAAARAADILAATKHGAYPVVFRQNADGSISKDADAGGAVKLAGLVHREHVKALLRASHLHLEGDLPPSLATRLAMSAFDPGTLRDVRPGRLRSRDEEGNEVCYDRLASRGDDDGSDDDTLPHYSEVHLHLERVMVRSPHLVYEDCPVSRAYRLFVTMGARHLLVVNHDGDLTGILTRHDMFEISQLAPPPQ